MPFGRFRRHSRLALVGAFLLGCSAQSAPATRTPLPETTAPLPALVSASDFAARPSSALEPPPAYVAWSYRAGAPLAGLPGIGADGAVVVGSVDGYLQALRSDGSFRWGYTLRGPLIGRPGLGADGSVFVSADPNGLYALDADGILLWVSSVPGGVKSPAVVDRQRRVWITTGQGTLLGFSAHGGIIGFARIGNYRTLGPAALTGGGVAIASINGELKIAGFPGAAQQASASGPVLELEATDDALLVLGAGGLSRFDTVAGEERWSRTDVARVACSDPALVVVEQQGLRWLSARGEPQAHVGVSVGPQRPIACLSDGSLLVVDEAGSLARVDRAGVHGRVKLPAGRLVSLDPARDGLVIAGYRDGRVLALRPPG